MKFVKQLLVIVSAIVLIHGVGYSLGVNSSSNLNGITMTPFLENVELNNQDTTKNITITYTNNTHLIQELDLTTKDFGSLDSTGGVILEGSNSYTQKFGLTSWMSLSNNILTLPPESSESVNVTISNLISMSPGGHYGAVVASVNNFNNPISGNHVSVNQELVNLIMIDKVGGNHFDLKLLNTSQNGNWLHLPNSVVLSFKNPGNVQVVPRGIVRLISPTNVVISQGIINPQSSFILPQTIQDMSVPLESVNKNYPLPGIYKVIVSFRYDGYNKFAVSSYDVKYVDLTGYLIILIFLILIFYVIKKYRYLSHKNK